jgi:hypothetical protein
MARALLVDEGKVAPPHVGKSSTPDYAKLRKEAVATTFGGVGKAFAGPADDPFFLDLRIFDLLYGGDFSEVGYDGCPATTSASRSPSGSWSRTPTRSRTRSSACGPPRRGRRTGCCSTTTRRR